MSEKKKTLHNTRYSQALLSAKRNIACAQRYFQFSCSVLTGTAISVEYFGFGRGYYCCSRVALCSSSLHHSEVLCNPKGIIKWVSKDNALECTKSFLKIFPRNIVLFSISFDFSLPTIFVSGRLNAQHIDYTHKDIMSNNHITHTHCNCPFQQNYNTQTIGNMMLKPQQHVTQTNIAVFHNLPHPHAWASDTVQMLTPLIPLSVGGWIDCRSVQRSWSVYGTFLGCGSTNSACGGGVGNSNP